MKTNSEQIYTCVYRFCLGGSVDQAILWPLGSLSFYGPSDKGIKGDVNVALAGHILQIPLMIILGILYASLRTEDMSALSDIFASYDDITIGFGKILLTLCMETFWYTLFIIGLNLVIPVYPFDGVRIWAAVIKNMGASLTKTAKIISIAGILISSCTFIFGIIEMLFYEIFGLAIFELIFGVLGLVSSKNLYDNIKAGRLRDDPIFGRACYANENESVEMSSTGNGSASDAIPEPVPVERVDTEGIV